MSAARPIVHPLLADCGVVHGFGVRGAPEPADCVRPRQVHGARVMTVRAGATVTSEEADAVVSQVAGLHVGIVTADCVPVLVAESGGQRVAAIHAGWRGLAKGVVQEALQTLVRAGASPPQLRAVVGPCIGVCCYEVDAPVLSALRARFGADMEPALRPTRPGHALLDLGRLVRVELIAAGLEPAAVAAVEGACTRCDATRFHSYRRDGAQAGRLLHAISAAAAPAES
jgi:YfiH family protein